MKISYNDGSATYVVTGGSRLGKVTLRNVKTGIEYRDYYSWADLGEKILSEEVSVVTDDTPTPVTSELKVEVDSTGLDSALAKAKELEATLQRVKALMP